MTTTDYRLPWLDTAGLEDWLDADLKGRYETRTNATWLRRLDPDRKGRDYDTGTYYLRGFCGHQDVPEHVWDRAQLRIVPVYSGLTVGPLTQAEAAEVAAAWYGTANGTSRAAAEKSLAEHRTMLDDLRANRITARYVTGKGTRKADAVEWLTSTIQKFQDALDTDGESNDVNRSNARYRARPAAD